MAGNGKFGKVERQDGRKRVRPLPTGNSLTQQHFTSHDGVRTRSHSSQNSVFRSYENDYLPIKVTGILHSATDNLSNVTVAITVSL